MALENRSGWGRSLKSPQRLDAVQKVRSRVVDGRSGAISVLGATLSRGLAQVIPKAPRFGHLRRNCVGVERRIRGREFGPLIQRLCVAERISMGRQS
jgi:hypothetical protein